MSAVFNTGDIAYAGYPTAHVFNFERNSKKKLVLARVKHLLWGDWTKITDYDYATAPEADIRPRPKQPLLPANQPA